LTRSRENNHYTAKMANLILAVNGEIYNHQEIRKRYEKPMSFWHIPIARSSFRSYRDKGPAFIEELNGIFAFAIYDKEETIVIH